MGGRGTGEQGLWLRAQGTPVSPSHSTDMQVFIKERQTGDQGCVGELCLGGIFPRDK